jgi:hypothetical protein
MPEPGRSIARLLSGCWRAEPSRIEPPLDVVAPAARALLRTGEAALLWRRLRGVLPQSDPLTGELREAARRVALQSAVGEGDVAEACRSLREAGLRACLGKGWALSRRYPQPGLRPCGDVDLYVRRQDAPRARRALARGPVAVDLHAGFADLDDRDASEIERRAEQVALGGGSVRLLGPEDHLRLVALHALRHGMLRPLWLCDVALLVESIPAGFDWSYFSAGHPRRSRAALVCFSLAEALLGASLEAVPVDLRAQPPSWLVPATLQAWSSGVPLHGARTPFGAALASPRSLWPAIRMRWPNPIEATARLSAPFDERPRLPYQLADVALRAAGFLVGR